VNSRLVKGLPDRAKGYIRNLINEFETSFIEKSKNLKKEEEIHLESQPDIPTSQPQR